MAQDIFLRLSKIKGESKDKVYENEIDVLAWSFGAVQSATMHMGGGGGSGKVAVQDLNITKPIDKSSPVLMKHCFDASHIAEGQLIVRKAGGKPVNCLTISMKEIIVSSYSTGGAGDGDTLTENLSLNCAEMAIQYIEQTADGGEGDKPDFAYSMRKNDEIPAFLMG